MAKSNQGGIRIVRGKPKKGQLSSNVNEEAEMRRYLASEPQIEGRQGRRTSMPPEAEFDRFEEKEEPLMADPGYYNQSFDEGGISRGRRHPGRQ